MTHKVYYYEPSDTYYCIYKEKVNNRRASSIIEAIEGYFLDPFKFDPNPRYSLSRHLKQSKLVFEFTEETHPEYFI